MRVYVPLTLDSLAEADEAGLVPSDLDRVVADDESEEGEYAALMTAADLSAELLAAAGGGPGRRVVLAADVDDVDGAVPRRAWAALHVDTTAGADPDDDLAWFATQEIPDVLAGR
ncbi:DUF6912 family protein [Nocardioides currus]|uniref:Uncharacterized protein n=1 Tax=Nocardioides currus TaxID=2133958 RepID=A0A2R7YTQ8_9ACTN|nr:hypothetical protein [Nocardioides currus]PUA79446.1 hypothetical protein C7S10_18915 [Nocardioides currus]